MLTNNKEILANIAARKSGLFLIIGDEMYLKEFYEDKLILEFEDIKDDSFNYHEFKNGISELYEIEDAILMPPVFSSKKVVIIRNIGIHDLLKNELDELLKAVDALPEGTTLIICESADGHGKPTNKNIKRIIKVINKKDGIIINGTRERGKDDLTRFTLGYLSNLGLKISRTNAKILAEYTYNDMALLTEEMGKIAAFLGSSGGEVTREVIDSLVVPHFETSIFSLSKEIMNRNIDLSLQILSRLKENMEEPIMVLNALSLSFVDLFRSKNAIRQGKTREEVGRDFKYANRAFVLSKSFSDASKHSMSYIYQMIDILSDVDHQMKSGFFDPFLSLEIGIAKLIKIL